MYNIRSRYLGVNYNAKPHDRMFSKIKYELIGAIGTLPCSEAQPTLQIDWLPLREAMPGYIYKDKLCI